MYTSKEQKTDSFSPVSLVVRFHVLASRSIASSTFFQHFVHLRKTDFKMLFLLTICRLFQLDHDIQVGQHNSSALWTYKKKEGARWRETRVAGLRWDTVQAKFEISQQVIPGTGWKTQISGLDCFTVFNTIKAWTICGPIAKGDPRWELRAHVQYWLELINLPLLWSSSLRK